MQLDNLGKGSENLTIQGSKLHPLNLKGSNAVTNLPDGTYTGNGEDVAMVTAANDTLTVFHDRGIPYRQTEENLKYAGSTDTPVALTFEAGVQYQFCSGCYIQFGWRSDPAIFKSNGTSDKPVVFTSASTDPKPGDWNGISLQGGTLEGSLIQHTEFHYGGKADGANLVIDTDKNIPITNSTFSNSAGYGVKLKPGNTTFDPEANTFEDNALGDTNLP